MKLGKVKKLLATIAPTIGTALGGTYGNVAAKFIAEKWLGRPASEGEVIDKMLAASPQELLALKQINLDFEKSMAELGIDQLKIESEDRDSARTMATNTTLWPQIIISALFVIGYFAILIAMGIKSLDFSVDPMTFGIVTVSMPLILQFWFGSSSGSKAKTAKLKAG